MTRAGRKRKIELEAEIERLQELLREIQVWCNAYPLVVFPEPDFKKAAELLAVGGITLDAISASNMRHVCEGIANIAMKAEYAG